MLGKVFSTIIITSFIFASLCGKMGQSGISLLSGSSDAVSLCISLCGTMCFWSGIMRVLDKAGFTKFLSKITMPFFKLIYSKNAIENSISYISASFTANFLGLGSACLPLGIKTIQCLSQNKNKKAAICDMATFAVLSTVPLQLIPTTLIALRNAHGSQSVFDIIIPAASDMRV